MRRRDRQPHRSLRTPAPVPSPKTPAWARCRGLRSLSTGEETHEPAQEGRPEGRGRRGVAPGPGEAPAAAGRRRRDGPRPGARAAPWVGPGHSAVSSPSPQIEHKEVRWSRSPAPDRWAGRPARGPTGAAVGSPQRWGTGHGWGPVGATRRTLSFLLLTSTRGCGRRGPRASPPLQWSPPHWCPDPSPTRAGG